jgi:hypothetical protein
MNNLKVLNTLVQGNNPISKFIPELTKTPKMKKGEIQSIDGILYLITHLKDSYFKHQNFLGCLNLSQKTLYSIFGQYNYRNNIQGNEDHVFNRLFGLWHKGNSIDEHGNSAFCTTDYFDKAYLEWLIANEGESVSLVDSTIKTSKVTKVDTFSHIFLDLDAINERLKDNYGQLRGLLTQINTRDRLDALGDEEVYDVVKIMQQNQPLTDELLYEVTVLQHILAQADGNKLTLFYKTSDAGRYYGFGAYHIQGMKKDLRKFILKGYKDYDIESASPVILSQVYTRITGKKTPKSIQYFIDNKEEFRVGLALFVESDMKLSKSIFTMLFFGSRTNELDIMNKSSLVKKVGLVKNEELLNNRYFKPLVRDIKMMFKVIGSHYKVNNAVKVGNKWIVRNDKGCSVEMERWDDGKVVSHVYQGIESIILDECINLYRSKHTNANYLLIHDGFYSQHEIDKNELKNYIKDKTGFVVDYEPRGRTLSYVQTLGAFGVYDKAVEIMQKIQEDKKIAKKVN